MLPAPPTRSNEQSSAASHPAKLLLLSVHEQSSAAIQKALIPPDFLLRTFSSVTDANTALSLDPTVDVILLDIARKPEVLTGWMEEIASRNAGIAQPSVLLITTAAHLPQAMQSGAYDYLLEPYSNEQLVATVHRVVEYRRLRLQNEIFRNHLDQLINTRTKILQESMRQLEQSYDVTLEALGNALDLKDAETEGHSKRVTAYTLALGRAMGLSEPELRMVGRGAFLHDIGKMAIPDAILRKPSKLTEEERAIMCTHCELGYRMIHKIPYLREASEIIYAHQEFYDGTGYPRGLRGEQIPIGARIFALADTLDAITSNRPYRKAETITHARAEMLRCAGTQFDPAVVDVFVATPDSLWLNLREGIMRDGPEFSPFGYTFGYAEKVREELNGR